MLSKFRLPVLVIALFFSCNLHAQLQSSTLHRLERSVIQVRSGGKTGSGFFWKNRRSIVTTLHLIGNPNDIRVTTSAGTRTAKVVKVLSAYDLVLLELNTPVNNSVPVFSTSHIAGAVNSELYSLGYNGGGNLSNIISRSLRIGYSSNNLLKGLLPLNIYRALNNCRRPDPDIQIIYLDGTLLPGFSGAPVVNSAAQLVGIADGGLEKGASSISWAVSSSFLSQLENSSEQISLSVNCSSGNTVAFSADVDLDDADLQAITIGTSLFVKTKTRSVYEMMQTVDDTTGLKVLMNYFGTNTNFNYGAFQYDIYEEIKSGAVFCVPAGAEVTLSGEVLKARLLGGEFIFIAKLVENIADTPDPFLKYNPTAIEFQNDIIKNDFNNLIYNFDPTLSYTRPIYFTDGLVNRYAGYGLKRDTSQSGVITPKPVSYYFNTLIGRKDKFLGVAVLNHAIANGLQEQINTCLMNGGCKTTTPPSGCISSCERMELFSKLIIGAHMAGISNIKAN